MTNKIPSGMPTNKGVLDISAYTVNQTKSINSISYMETAKQLFEKYKNVVYSAVAILIAVVVYKKYFGNSRKGR